MSWFIVSALLKQGQVYTHAASLVEAEDGPAAQAKLRADLQERASAFTCEEVRAAAVEGLMIRRKRA